MLIIYFFRSWPIPIHQLGLNIHQPSKDQNPSLASSESCQTAGHVVTRSGGSAIGSLPHHRHLWLAGGAVSDRWASEQTSEKAPPTHNFAILDTDMMVNSNLCSPVWEHTKRCACMNNQIRTLIRLPSYQNSFILEIWPVHLSSVSVTNQTLSRNIYALLIGINSITAMLDRSWSFVFIPNPVLDRRKLHDEIISDARSCSESAGMLGSDSLPTTGVVPSCQSQHCNSCH